MKYSAALLAVQLICWATAINLAKRDNPKVLGVDIQRRNLNNPVAHDHLRRRQKTVQQTLDNLETLYFANLTLGTPQRRFRLHIDTGSSDLWVNAKNSSLCSQDGLECSVSGTYDAAASSTYKFINHNFNITYVDGSGASGDYVEDTLHFGGKKINNFRFGVGYESTSNEGILGIGYAINEVGVTRFGAQIYPNLPAKLVKDGFTNSNAYSLWLNDLDASTGNILFGGVDTAKYHGTLKTLPIIPTEHDPNVYRELLIAMTGMSRNGRDETLLREANVPVLLDTGSSLMYLPDEIVIGLYKYYRAVYDPAQGAAFVDCNRAYDKERLDFDFSGVTISVDMSELVITAGLQGDTPVCIFGIAPAGDSVCVLGDTFLRSAYIVYDLDNNEISLAQTKFNTTETSIEEIVAGANGVPDATDVPNAVSTAPSVQTGGGRNGGPGIHPTASPSSHQGKGSPRVTPEPWVGAVVGAAVMGLGFGVRGGF